MPEKCLDGVKQLFVIDLAPSHVAQPEINQHMRLVNQQLIPWGYRGAVMVTSSKKNAVFSQLHIHNIENFVLLCGITAQHLHIRNTRVGYTGTVHVHRVDGELLGSEYKLRHRTPYFES